MSDTLFDYPQSPKQKSNEWYTPARYVDAAREVMGGIDLDPASCYIANELVKATNYYTEEMDGLKQRFYGKVWCNPPYGKINNKSTIDLWIRKIIREYRLGNVEQAVLLTTCDSDNSWFQLFWDFLICFTDHNVHFFKPINGKIRKDSRSTQMFGTVFVYIGTNEQKFIEIFSQFGRIAKAIDTPKQHAILPTLWDGGITI